ncbi:MAG: deoxyribonuclease IV [Clostridia bacterium]|nr:deoxyribonuclease IV [Clostridia bacterium]
MIYLGCHLSSSGGYLSMGETAVSLGADTFQFFTRNPRGGSAKKFDVDDAAALVSFMREHGFGRIVAHAPYTLNPASAEQKTREFANMVFADDIAILEHIPGSLYNFHPGSHVGQGVEVGTGYILEMLNANMSHDMKTTVLLETMSGKGSEIGSSFEELAAIIDGCEFSEHLGVCLDTCHISDAGYDVKDGLDGTLEEFDRVIGLSRLFAVHLNDSKNPRGARKDRHEKIGQGYIGLEYIEKIINHPSLQGLPFELETPNDNDGYAAEIKLLRGMKK